MSSASVKNIHSVRGVFTMVSHLHTTPAITGCLCIILVLSPPSLQQQEGVRPTLNPNEPTYHCETITMMPWCSSIYPSASFPNYRGHEDQLTANQELTNFAPLVQTVCSNAIVHFLCSIYAPLCQRDLPNIRLRPCRELCEYVRSTCEENVRSYNLDWPPHLDCDNFSPNASTSLDFCPENLNLIRIPAGIPTLAPFNTISPAGNNPPVINGPPIFNVSLNQESSFIITVVDSNLVRFSIISGDITGGILTRDEADPTRYTFTWTPTAITTSPIVFLATDDRGELSQYTPRIQFCQCRRGSRCTLEGVMDQFANPVDLNCVCTTGYEGRYCDIDIDGCASELTACFEGVDCVDNPAPSEGASCGPCPQGYSGNGTECKVLVSTMASPETATNDMASPETTTNDMETLTLLQWQNAVIVTLPGLTTIMFTEEQQQLFREATASVVNSYCREYLMQCEMWQGLTIQANDIFLTNIISGGDENTVEFHMYLQISDRVLQQQVLLDAMKSNADDYTSAGFQTFTVHALTSPGLTKGGIAAITVASIEAALLLLMIIFLLCYCCFKKFRSGRVGFNKFADQAPSSFAKECDLKGEEPVKDNLTTGALDNDNSL